MGSYLGIADILNSDGASPAEDLPKVWRRMAFALLTGQLTPPSGGFLCGKNSAGGWLRPTDGVRIREPHGQ